MASKQNLKPLIVGNWKMNGLGKDVSYLKRLIEKLEDSEKQRPKQVDALVEALVEAMICPPATLIDKFADSADGSPLKIGAQNSHVAKKGAHTGDISAHMLKEAGAEAVIIGHSERRNDYAEEDKQVQHKANAAHRAGLWAIICVGETLKERDAGDTLQHIAKQLRESFPSKFTPDNTVIAYEPIWAIGTGLTPTMAEIEKVHAYIRKKLRTRYDDKGKAVRILYGGSVNPANARDILSVENVNGALVGGASLKADDFYQIISSAEEVAKEALKYPPK